MINWRLAPAAALAAFLALPTAGVAGDADSTEAFSIRGRTLTLHLYGGRGSTAAIVTSGDGGWIHLGPEVARFLAARGFFVVGFDAKAYLSAFTKGGTTLTESDVPSDFGALVDFAARGARGRPLLFGVSVGAGLSVLAASDPQLQEKIAGVVALGLPEQNELGWRFRDSVIYVTKKAPHEPLFSARAVVGRVSPTPLALFRSTHDEFVTPAESEAIWAEVREPRRLYTIAAADHRFSDNQAELQRRLTEAIEWIGRTTPGAR